MARDGGGDCSRHQVEEVILGHLARRDVVDEFDERVEAVQRLDAMREQAAIASKRLGLPILRRAGIVLGADPRT